MVERYIIPEWLINRDIIRDGTTIRLMDDKGVITGNTVVDCRKTRVLGGIQYRILFQDEQEGSRELILRYDANNSQVYSIYKGIVNKHHIVFEENPEWVALQIAKKRLALGNGMNERLVEDSVLSDLPVELFERISAQIEDSVNKERTLRTLRVDQGGGQGGGQRKKRSKYKRSNKRSKSKRSKSKRSKRK